MNLHEYEAIKQNVRRTYDVAALDYHSLFRNELDDHEYDRSLLDRFAENFSPESILCDIGCGPSVQYGGYLFSKGLNVHGLDFSKSCIDNARALYPNMVFHLDDMTNTALPDGMFDGILSFYALFHIPRKFQHEVFSEFRRLLKPNGKLLLVTHKGSLTKTIHKIWNHDNIDLFMNFSSERHIRRLLKDSGFIIDAVDSVKSYYGFPKERIIAFAAKP